MPNGGIGGVFSAVAAQIHRRYPVHRTFAEASSSPGSGARSGALRRISRKSTCSAPCDLRLKNVSAVSTELIFCATASDTHWFSETPSSSANFRAAFPKDGGNSTGIVSLFISAPRLQNLQDSK